MKISHSFDKDGATIEKIEYEPGELEAIDKAYEIIEARCAEAGVEFGRDQREWMGWCFEGALRLGGIPELMRYVTEAKICGKKKIVSVGYASTVEMEVMK